MIERILRFSITQRWLVLFGVALIAALGIQNYEVLPIDAVPDITNVQVQINTQGRGFSPLEIEQRITFPIETTLSGLPRLDYTRSLSRYGLSQVTVVFKDGTDIYFARNLIAQRIQQIKGQLPEGISPEMGPISTGLGEVYMYTVEAKKGPLNEQGKPYTASDLHTIQEWVIKPQLRTVPGVNEVNTIGGFEKQYQVAPFPDKLLAYGFSFADVIEGLTKNNANVGAGYIERNGEQYLVRTPGQVANIEDIRNIVLGNRSGVPVRICDVAEVSEGTELRSGAATLDGEEVVLGTTFMLMGENSRSVSQRVAERIKEVNRTLPAGVVANTVYNRTALVDATIDTVKRNLLEGALLVIFVLFVLLGNIRAALITALVIPLSMLFTITGMVTNKVSANLMSLGAIDFGIIVDGAVIIVENCIRRLADEQRRSGRLLSNPERYEVVFDATREVVRPSLLGSMIIMVVYLPILTLTGIEGKMFIPMALTVLGALIGAMIFSVTFVPAAVAIFLSKKVSEKENSLMRLAKAVYKPLLNASLHNRGAIVAAAIVLIALSFLLAARMGGEFIPSLDEGDLCLEVRRPTGIGLEQSVQMESRLEKRLLEFPEVRMVFARVGVAEIASDPQGPGQADVYVMLKPETAWPNPAKPKRQLVEEVDNALKEIPGTAYEISQPVLLRMNELVSGVKSDIAVKLFGDNMDLLIRNANKIRDVLGTVAGASEPKVEQVSGLPMLNIELDRPALARYGVNVADVQSVIEAAIGGKDVGQVFEGDRRFDLVVRLPEDVRTNLAALKRIPIPLGGQDSGKSEVGREEPRKQSTRGENLVYFAPPFVPLGAVAKFNETLGPNQISRENGKREIVVTCNVRGRDMASFVAEAQQKIRDFVKIPAGYWVAWGGQFEHLISATNRLRVVVPIALLLIFLLLFMSFRKVKDALLVYTGVPLALTGGIAALCARGIPLSISAGVGFIALSGVAVLNGVVMISFINQLRQDGMPLEDAIRQGSLTRLRPVLMTALVASLGFLPMALATGRGAEVQRPLATVVIGGILSSTALTLFVLPAIYRIFHRREEESEAKQTTDKTRTQPAPTF
jgi:heavy metal efflux system protein